MTATFPGDLGIVIVDHGSTIPEANEMLLEVVRLFKKTTDAMNVEPAHMELAPPTIEDAFRHCVENGAKRIVVHPYFLSPGRHSTSDIPRMANDAASKFPGLSVSISQPLGVDSRLTELIRRRVLDALASTE